MRLLIISTVMTLSLTVILTPTLSYADNEGSYKIGSSGNMNITQNGINAKITAPPGSTLSSLSVTVFTPVHLDGTWKRFMQAVYALGRMLTLGPP